MTRTQVQKRLAEIRTEIVGMRALTTVIMMPSLVTRLYRVERALIQAEIQLRSAALHERETRAKARLRFQRKAK